MALDEIKQSRIDKLSKLRSAGIDPYPAKSWRTHTIAQALDGFDDFVKNKNQLVLVGRVMAMRGHGAITFIDLRDGTGTIQILHKKDKPSETTDIGDFIEAFGTLFTTAKGEKTLEVEKWRMLTKSLAPLPEKWHGLQDKEERYRRRYLDMIMDAGVRQVFEKRAKIVAGIRGFLEKNGFLEVSTPALQTLYGGASARPFKTHLNALDMDLFLRIAPELYLKRLLVGGFDRVFEFVTNFRNEGIDREHNPEFSAVEFYAAYEDYEWGMKFIEDMMVSIAPERFRKPFRRVKYEDLMREHGSLEDSVFKEKVRPHIIEPTFVTGYPKEMFPLAKDVFQFYVGGLELVKAFSELNDPIDQRERFSAQENKRAKGDEEAQRMDEDFIEALEYGMPPAAGFGIGIDRLVMFLTDQHSIRDVIPFPFMRPKDLKEITARKAKESKIAVAVVNTSAGMERWQEMNTIAHLNAAFGARMGRELLYQDKITTKDNQAINLNIQHAIMIKMADSSQEIMQLIKKAHEADLEVAEFTREMLETTDDKKVIATTKQKDQKEIEYLGVLIFGKKTLVEGLTKELKLFT